MASSPQKENRGKKGHNFENENWGIKAHYDFEGQYNRMSILIVPSWIKYSNKNINSMHTEFLIRTYQDPLGDATVNLSH